MSVEDFKDLADLPLEKLFKLRDIAKDDVRRNYNEYGASLDHLRKVDQEISQKLGGNKQRDNTGV